MKTIPCSLLLISCFGFAGNSTTVFAGEPASTNVVAAPLPALSANEAACESPRKPTSPPCRSFPNLVETALANQAVEDGLIDKKVAKCQHHICNGDKCFIVDDEVAATTPSCTLNQKCSLNDKFVSEATDECGSEESLLILETLQAPPEVNAGSSANRILKHPSSDENVPREYVDLLVKNAELEARLNATEKWTAIALEQAKALVAAEKEKAKLEAELTAYRAQLELTARYTSALVERAELEVKLQSAQEWISNRTAMEIASGSPTPLYAIPEMASAAPSYAAPYYHEQFQIIHEDLANLRRQLPLIRQTPIPFAASGSIPTSVPSLSHYTIPYPGKIVMGSSAYVPTSSPVQTSCPTSNPNDTSAAQQTEASEQHCPNKTDGSVPSRTANQNESTTARM